MRQILKIKVSRLKDNDWNLTVNRHQAIKNNELVSIAESDAIRAIDRFKMYDIDRQKIGNLKKEIVSIKRRIRDMKYKTSRKGNIENLKKLSEELHKLTFVDEYVSVIMDNERTINKDFDRANQGFFINGNKYERLLAIPGQARKNAVIYIKCDIKEYLLNKIHNGRNMNLKLSAGKLEAYMSLIFSSSIPVSDPKGVVVVPDCITNFKENVIEIDDSGDGEPLVERKINYPIELNNSDGYGLILPSLAAKWAEELELDYIPSAFIIRNSFCKGVLVVFDFHEFVNRSYKEKRIKTKKVKDIWNESDNNILKKEVVLTQSMLKLWRGYTGYDDYYEKCKLNESGFSVIKVSPKKHDDERCMNYQFLQSINLTDHDIDQLIKPTVTEYMSVINGDVAKSLLFLKGKKLDSDSFSQMKNDFSKAMMIEPSIHSDKYVNTKINSLIKDTINDAKLGDIKVKGNYTIICGDPYALCESMFNIEIKGLLGKGEFYSRYWSDREVNKVAGFRAPMSCAENIRILHIVDNTDMEDWYRYLNGVTIINAWDTTANALNGADMDGDTIFTTNNPTLLSRIKELDTIICLQNQASEPKIVTEEDLIEADRNSFGDAIGRVTNIVTAMTDVRAKYKIGTIEYDILTERIQCGQNYQQNTIDKSKGTESKDMPEVWFSPYSNKIIYEDTIDKKGNLIKADSPLVIKYKKLNYELMANKKPYFLQYRYDSERVEWKRFYDQINRKCIREFDKKYINIQKKTDKTEEEKRFIGEVEFHSPCSLSPSVMNKICWKIEEVFDKRKFVISENKFDYEVLKSNRKYKPNDYTNIANLYREYKELVKDFHQRQAANKKNGIDDDEYYDDREVFKESFKEKAIFIVINKEELSNIVVDLCYKENASKSFMWDVCGEQIVQNLLDKNNSIIHYPIEDNSGDILYGGIKYKMVTQMVGGIKHED